MIVSECKDSAFVFKAQSDKFHVADQRPIQVTITIGKFQPNFIECKKHDSDKHKKIRI